MLDLWEEEREEEYLEWGPHLWPLELDVWGVLQWDESQQRTGDGGMSSQRVN